MTPKLWLALGAAAFLLIAAWAFGPEAAQSLFDTLSDTVGEVS